MHAEPFVSSKCLLNVHELLMAAGRCRPRHCPITYISFDWCVPITMVFLGSSGKQSKIQEWHWEAAKSLNGTKLCLEGERTAIRPVSSLSVVPSRQLHLLLTYDMLLEIGHPHA